MEPFSICSRQEVLNERNTQGRHSNRNAEYERHAGLDPEPDEQV